MPTIRILTEADLRPLVPLDLTAIGAVEAAFEALATKPVAMPPILRLDIPEHRGLENRGPENRGEVDVKTAYIPGLPSFAIKISPGFFGNPALGLPSVNGMMVVLSATTGLVEALLLDNGYLTDVRTAAAGAVAARHLSRPEASVAAIFGAGMQARLQLTALTLVRPIREARLWARDLGKAEAAARALSAELGIPVSATTDGATAADGADILVTTTPSETPILMAGWLAPGCHVTAMGSDAGHKNELDPAAIARAGLYVADCLSQTRLLGELHHAIRAGVLSAEAGFSELGAIVAGRAAGRPSPQAITVADLTGTGVQDTAIAALAITRATDAGAGTRIQT